MAFFLLLFVIAAVTAIFLTNMVFSHQRQLAGVRPDRADLDERMRALESQVAALKDAVHEQTILLDGLNRPNAVAERIHEVTR